MNSDHRGNKVGKNHKPSFQSTHRITHSQDTDIAPPHGIPRPNLDEVEEAWEPEDIAEHNYWNDHYKHHQLGYPAQEFRDKGYPDSFFEER